MAENKHTPTPWKKGFFTKDGQVKGLGLFQAEAKDGETVNAICLLTDMPNLSDVDEANADHILRCVNTHDELVEALEDAKRQIEYLHDKFKETGTGNAVLAIIDSALKKATN